MQSLICRLAVDDQVLISIMTFHFFAGTAMAAEKFEASLKKLEEVVRKLEGGTLSLDDSIKAFEEGVRHAAFCAKKLDEAERKVEMLVKQRDGSFRKEPFGLNGDDEA